MKKYVITFFLAIILLNVSGQVYNSIPIQHDTAFQWAAECDKVINLTPKASQHSLKKWYTEKLKKGVVIAYAKREVSNYFSAYELSMPQLEKQEWLKGLTVEVSPNKHLQEWYFVDTTISGYERFKYRGGVLNTKADACCGCDDADAFRTRQMLQYKNGKFNISNVFISPLCARQTEKPPFEWYPLCNVAYNGNFEGKFPGPGKEVVMLNTNEVDYNFDRQHPSSYDSVLTVYKTDIGSLIYQDILKGRLKAVDIETGKIIPAKKLMTLGMSADTVGVYDINDPTRITAYKVVQEERSSSDFNRIRIKQDLYFDFKNERLYSVVRAVTLMQIIKLPDGTIRGQLAFCRLE